MLLNFVEETFSCVFPCFLPLLCVNSAILEWIDWMGIVSFFSPTDIVGTVCECFCGACEHHPSSVGEIARCSIKGMGSGLKWSPKV